MRNLLKIPPEKSSPFLPSHLHMNYILLLMNCLCVKVALSPFFHNRDFSFTSPLYFRLVKLYFYVNCFLCFPQIVFCKSENSRFLRILIRGESVKVFGRTCEGNVKER